MLGKRCRNECLPDDDEARHDVCMPLLKPLTKIREITGFSLLSSIDIGDDIKTLRSDGRRIGRAFLLDPLGFRTNEASCRAQAKDDGHKSGGY